MWAPSSPLEFCLHLQLSRRSRWSHHADFLRMRLWRCQSWHPPRFPQSTFTEYQHTRAERCQALALCKSEEPALNHILATMPSVASLDEEKVASKKKKLEVKWHCSTQKTTWISWGNGEKKSCIKLLQRISLEHRTGTILRCQLGA